jgi:hypothetical protein
MTTNTRQQPEPPPRKIRTEIHVIPALAGFNLPSPVYETGSRIVEVAREPIIAWRIETSTFRYADENRPERIYSHSEPITVEGSIGLDAECCAIEYPDGRCNVPGDRTCADARELLKYWQETKHEENLANQQAVN